MEILHIFGNEGELVGDVHEDKKVKVGEDRADENTDSRISNEDGGELMHNGENRGTLFRKIAMAA